MNGPLHRSSLLIGVCAGLTVGAVLWLLLRSPAALIGGIAGPLITGLMLACVCGVRR